VTLYHGGSLERDVYGNASFYGMKNVTMMFDERPYFAQIFARACEEINCNITTLEYLFRVCCPILHLRQLSDG
jgi:hypothetical protein